MIETEDSLADAFSRKCDEARQTLLGHMEARGMHSAEGWRIMETTRIRDGAAELVMRPIHRILPTPSDLECVVTIHTPPSWDVDLECST